MATEIEVPEGMIEAVQAGRFNVLDSAALRRLLKLALEWQAVQERSELDKLGHGIAYDATCTMIKSSCFSVGDSYDWFDVGVDAPDDLSGDAVSEAVRYLEARGLLERDPHHPDWVSFRNESEATN